MNYKFFLSSFVVVFLFTACAVQDLTKVVRLNPIQTASKFGDSLFLSNEAFCIDYNKGFIYISDWKVGFYSLDQNLKFNKFMSKLGKGHNEVVQPSMIYAENGIATLFSEGTQKFCFYDSSSMLRQDKETVGVRILGDCRFFTKGDTVFLPIFDEKNLVAVSVNGQIVKKTCPILNGYDDTRNSVLSQRHLLKGENSFYVVGKCLPIIQEYSYDGKEIGRYDLRNIEILSGQYKKNDDLKSTYGTCYGAVRDAYYKNGIIYLLAYEDEGEYSCNSIIALSLKNNEVNHLQTYKFPDTVYVSFCVTDKNECYAINKTKGAIETFNFQNINE